MLYNHINNNCANTYAETQADSNTQVTLLFRYEHLLTSEFGSLIQGKRDNSYYADCTIWPHKRAAHPIVFKISVGRDLQNSMVRLQPLNTRILIQLLNCLPLRQTTPMSVYMAQSHPSNSRLHGRELNSLCPKAEKKIVCLTWPKVNSQLTSF